MTPGLHGEESGHTHEWGEVEDDDVYLEDYALIVFQRCEYVEITGSTYSERHDEVFYDEGWQCEASRSFRFDLDCIEKEGGVTVSTLRLESEVVKDYLPVMFAEFAGAWRCGEIDIDLEFPEEREEVEVEMNGKTAVFTREI